MRSKKPLRLGVLALVIACALAVLAGCGGSQANVQSAEGGTDRFDITVTHFPTGYYSLPYEVAIDRGFFENENIEIGKIIPGEGGGTTVRNVLSGNLPFGDVATAAAIQSFNTGAPVQIVGGSVRTFGSTFYVTRKGAPIDGFEDLKGKRYGVTNPGSSTETAAQLIFEEEGIKKGEIEIVHTGGSDEGMVMLEQGEVDATLLSDPVYSMEKEQWKTLFNISDYLPSFQQSVIVANPDLAQRDPDLVRRFLSAHERAVDWIYENPEEAGRIFAKYAEIPKEPSVESVKRLAGERFWSTGLDVEATNYAVRGMQLSGTLEEDQTIAWTELLNQEFISEDLRVDPKKLDTGA